MRLVTSEASQLRIAVPGPCLAWLPFISALVTRRRPSMIDRAGGGRGLQNVAVGIGQADAETAIHLRREALDSAVPVDEPGERPPLAGDGGNQLAETRFP